MDKPQVIYKYEAFSAKSLQNLKAQSIYFGSPLNFNDPYDCALKASVETPTDIELELLRDAYSKRPDVPELIQQQFKATNLDELRAAIVSNTEATLKNNVKTFLETNGVSCFSERNDDLLMWSHYGGRYRGFCLAFATEYEPFTQIRKVEYSKTMPKFNAAEALLKDDFEQMLELFCTKSQSWNYEKEWRCIHNQAGTLFTYEAHALKSIYFGPDIDAQSLEIVCLILAGQNPDVELWKGTRSNDKFEVNFEQFTYTSHIDAVRSGLIT